MRQKPTTFDDRVTIRLPTGTLDRLHEQAKAERTSPAEIMRQAILQRVEEMEEVES
jgi:predicted DNA-binding protein